MLARELGSAAFSRVDAAALRKLERLDELVVKWSRVVGLTGFSSDAARVRRYFAEPLAVAARLPGQGAALDVGSGGGSPVLPFAIARAQVSWTLVESNERKAMFLEEAIRELSLDARVSRSRYEAAAPQSVDVVTLRGVRVSRPMQEGILAALRPGGRFLWFSAEEHLRKAAAQERLWDGLSISGPSCLLPAREHSIPSGWVLVVEKRAAEDDGAEGAEGAEGECFT